MTPCTHQLNNLAPARAIAPALDRDLAIAIDRAVNLAVALALDRAIALDIVHARALAVGEWLWEEAILVPTGGPTSHTTTTGGTP